MSTYYRKYNTISHQYAYLMVHLVQAREEGVVAQTLLSEKATKEGYDISQVPSHQFYQTVSVQLHCLRRGHC
jgi:hypothetical protein